MRLLAVFWVLAALLSISRPVGAQGLPPIPRVVADLHLGFTTFPNTSALALSRGLNQSELPGLGPGADLGVHFYPLKWRAVTFGVGARFTKLRAHRSPAADAPDLRPVTEHFTYLTPELSFNFGTGAGWSYVSGGLSTSTWSLVPDGTTPSPPNEEHLTTLNYGGGARWFIKPHVAFSFDVRFYTISEGTPYGDLPPSPRTALVVIGAGISLKVGRSE